MKVINLNFLKNKKKSTLEIIEGCREGDTQCQEILFRKYAGVILTVCRRYEHPSFGASDILQETFILIFKNIKQFDPLKGNVETWMKRIAVNTALKFIRKRKIHFLDFETNEYQVENLPEESIDVEVKSKEILIEKIQELPNGYRTIFNLFVMEGYSHREIATILDITVQTSKSQLSRAKKLLRKKMIDSGLIRRNKNIENH